MNTKEQHFANRNTHSSEESVNDRIVNWRMKIKRGCAKQPWSSDRVEGMYKMIAYVIRNHLVAFNTIDDYFNSIPSPKKKIIAFTQVAILWMGVIKFQLNALIRNDYLDILTGNIIPIFIRKHVIFTQLLVFNLILFSSKGKFIKS